MNPDLKAELARAFGLATDGDVDGLLARLRSGAEVDAATLRAGCLALVERLGDDAGARAHREQRVQMALRAAQVSFWDLDLRTREIFVDHTCFEMLGLPRAERTLPFDELERLTHPDDRETQRQAVVDLITGKSQMLHLEHRLQHADGRWVWMENFGNITGRDEHGRVVRISGTRVNITERKQLERALSNTLRVMRTLLETMPLPVIMRDAERRVTLVNAAWENMLGIPRQEIIGKRIESHPRKVLSDNHLESDIEVLEYKRSLRFETVVHGVDGTDYDVIVAKTPLLADDGTVTGLAAVITDISVQKRIAADLEKARQAAEAAMHAKSRFLANMSHELRTPLNGVVGMASLLESTALDARQRRFVRTLKASAEALITLINDVLDLSKAEAGKLDLDSAPFELRREIEQVVGLFSARACDKGVELAAHIAADVPPIIHGDPIRLRQVLGNLVNNAVKFTESGAVLVAVHLAASNEASPMLEFSVADTGVGIPHGEQQRIFDAFEQGDGSVTRRFGGTGLGLAISRQLVDLMRGSLGVQSSPGQGSRFWFRIPAGVPSAAAPCVARQANMATVVVGMHPLLHDAVRESLARDGSEVLISGSVPAAADLLARLGPHLQRVRVILDCMATSRLEHSVSLLRAAAQSRSSEGRQVEVIALLAPDAEASLAPGVTRCIVKPLLIPDLGEPLPDASHTTGNSTRIRALPPRGSRGLALVVEDNAVNQEMARAMLDMLGFQVLTASNGQEGVQAAAANPELNLIFMDCQMPVMDGLAAARAIRDAECGGRVPIVALTGNAMPGDREACVAAGMDDYLAKPFSLSALRAVIDKWVKAA